MWARNAVFIDATNPLTRRELIRPAATVKAWRWCGRVEVTDCTRR